MGSLDERVENIDFFAIRNLACIPETNMFATERIISVTY